MFQVFAVGTEDMDALTLGAPILLRNLTKAEARKMPIVEIHLDSVLDGLNLTMDEVCTLLFPFLATVFVVCFCFVGSAHSPSLNECLLPSLFHAHSLCLCRVHVESVRNHKPQAVVPHILLCPFFPFNLFLVFSCNATHLPLWI